MRNVPNARQRTLQKRVEDAKRLEEKLVVGRADVAVVDELVQARERVHPDLGMRVLQELDQLRQHHRQHPEDIIVGHNIGLQAPISMR